MKHKITSLNTKRTLAESLKKIMRNKSFSKITISEIVADCGLNRKTFYYHFEDTNALLRWMLDEEAIEVVKHFDFMEDYEQAILFVMDYVDANEHIINCAYDSLGREQMKTFFYSDFEVLVTKIIDGSKEKLGIIYDKEYEEFLCEFITEALAGILINWIKNRENSDRQKTIDYISRTFKALLLNGCKEK